MKLKANILLLFLTSFLWAGCSALQHQENGGQNKPATHAYTPPRGSAERNAILVAVHKAIEKQDATRKIVLVVPYLKAHNGWAWIQVNPQSPDGTQHYESQSGLLHKESNGNWMLLEWMPAEEGTDYKKYFKDLKAKYPSAPADIFPQ